MDFKFIVCIKRNTYIHTYILYIHIYVYILSKILYKINVLFRVLLVVKCLKDQLARFL